jgi:ubiquinone/menaquinone biosynthesis C-methylase UbiE
VNTWYERTFSRDYLSLYPHRNSEEARRDVLALIALVDPPRNEPLLDLCCGAGRHLVALHRAGFSCLTGLDLSPDLLAEASHRFREEGIEDVQLIRADMRDIPSNDHYHTIVSLFTSFGYFAELHEDERVLSSAYHALVAGGTFLLDTLNRDRVVDSLVPIERKEFDGKTIDITRRITDDGLRVEKTTRISQPGSPETIYHESVRMYTRVELADMLSHVGFLSLRFYGNLEGQAYSSTSARTVIVASKASS